MSTAENIAEWKKKADIDYIPLFVSLWFSLNAWMRYRFSEGKDRARLELLKRGGHQLYDTFAGLLRANNAKGNRFSGNLAALHRSLKNAHIPYDKFPNYIVSFENCVIDWNNGKPKFESMLKQRRGRNKLKIDEDLWVENNAERLFAAYMEIVYQIRCSLFHGDLAPVKENEQVIRYLFLTLAMVMENV